MAACKSVGLSIRVIGLMPGKGRLSIDQSRAAALERSIGTLWVKTPWISKDEEFRIWQKSTMDQIPKQKDSSFFSFGLGKKRKTDLRTSNLLFRVLPR